MRKLDVNFIIAAAMLGCGLAGRAMAGSVAADYPLSPVNDPVEFVAEARAASAPDDRLRLHDFRFMPPVDVARTGIVLYGDSPRAAFSNSFNIVPLPTPFAMGLVGVGAVIVGRRWRRS